jgi:hypothetical protein
VVLDPAEGVEQGIGKVGQVDPREGRRGAVAVNLGATDSLDGHAMRSFPDQQSTPANSCVALLRSIIPCQPLYTCTIVFRFPTIHIRSVAGPVHVHTSCLEAPIVSARIHV